MRTCPVCKQHKIPSAWDMCASCAHTDKQRDAAIGVWAANGIRALEVHLATYAAFADYLRDHSLDN